MKGIYNKGMGTVEQYNSKNMNMKRKTFLDASKTIDNFVNNFSQWVEENTNPLYCDSKSQSVWALFSTPNTTLWAGLFNFHAFDNSCVYTQELRNIFTKLETLQTATRKDYVKEYYTDKKDKYISKEFTTTDGVKYTAETYEGRKPLQSEIDASAYLTKRGHSVVFLDEETKSEQFKSHPDILVDNKYLFEIKSISKNSLNTIEQNIKKGTKNGIVDVPIIYWNGTNDLIKIEEVQNRLNNIVKDGTFFNENFNYACIFQNDQISVVENKNKETLHRTRGTAAIPFTNFNVPTNSDNVKSKTQKYAENSKNSQKNNKNDELLETREDYGNIDALTKEETKKNKFSLNYSFQIC